MMSSLSVRTRFEIFKRDRFTCQYCGKTPPNVLLEVDHILPLSGGGTDDEANLTTACQECNRGKTNRLLEEGTAPAINQAATEAMRERLEQAQAYMETLSAYRALTDKMVWRVYNAWFDAYGGEVRELENGQTTLELKDRQSFPNDASIRRFLRDLSLDDVLYAVEQTAARLRFANDGACRYFYAICHSTIRIRRQDHR